MATNDLIIIACITAGVSYRAIYNLHHISSSNNFLFIMPAGQSGHVASRFYNHFTTTFLKNSMITFKSKYKYQLILSSRQKTTSLKTEYFFGLKFIQYFIIFTLFLYIFLSQEL